MPTGMGSTGIGEVLRAARRRQGASLADAAAATRVRESYLAALEEEDFSSLGGDVYVKGFLRSYAKFLGVDPEPLLAAYRREHERDEVSVAQAPVQPMLRERQPGLGIVAVAAAVVVVLLIAVGLGRGGREDVPEIPAPKAADQTSVATTPTPGEPAGVPDEAAGGLDETAPGVDPQIQGVQVAVDVARGESWLRVVVDGTTELEGVRPQGTRLTFEGDEEILVRVGNAAAVSVVANGADQGVLGSQGQVVELRCRSGEVDCERTVVA